LRREGAEICSEGFQAASVNFRTTGSVKYFIYLSTPSNIWKATDFLKVYSLFRTCISYKKQFQGEDEYEALAEW
jgi:hypothetical protein